MPKDVGMGLRAAIAVMTCALVLAACGGSSNSGTSAGVPVPPTTGSTGTQTTQTTQTTATTGPNTSPGAPPACVTSNFALRYLGQAGATGHGEIGFALRNIAPYQCRTYGYPGILFLGRTGNAVPTHPTRTTVDFFGNTAKTELVVLPGASVSFRLGVNHGAANPSGCTTAYALQVIAPDDTRTTRTRIGQGGAYECGGAVTVSPLQPAETAFSH